MIFKICGFILFLICILPSESYARYIGITLETTINYLKPNMDSSTHKFEFKIRAWNNAGDEPAYAAHPTIAMKDQLFTFDSQKFLPVVKDSFEDTALWEKLIEFEKAPYPILGDYPVDIRFYYQDVNMYHSSSDMYYETIQIATARFNPESIFIPNSVIKCVISPQKPKISLLGEPSTIIFTIINPSNFKKEVELELFFDSKLKADFPKTNTTIPAIGQKTIPINFTAKGNLESSNAIFLSVRDESKVDGHLVSRLNIFSTVANLVSDLPPIDLIDKINLFFSSQLDLLNWLGNH